MKEEIKKNEYLEMLLKGTNEMLAKLEMGCDVTSVGSSNNEDS